MNHYYLNNNKQANNSGGNYELHKSICPYYYNYKSGENFIYIGYFANDWEALNACKQKFPTNINKIDGCYYCCQDIHKK